MKILVVSQYFWPENFRINDLCVGLVEKGHDVTVLTGCPNYPSGTPFPGYGIFNREESYNGVRVVRVPLLPRGNSGGLRLILNYLSFALSASILGPLLCRGKFDVIFICQLSPVTVALPALLLKRLKRLPALLWILDLWPESLTAAGGIRSPLILKGVDRLVRFIYGSCDRILLGSQGFMSSVIEKGVPSQKIEFFPNWYEPEYATAASDCPVDMPDGFRVVFAGNVGVAQDFPTLLAAAEKLRGTPDIRWIIIGDGRALPWAQEQVMKRGLGGYVFFLGRHAAQTMPSFFAAADAMLVILKKDPLFALTVPGKIQSYMACSKPIIASLDGEGGRVISESCSGIAVAAEDPDALANAVMTMYRMSKAEREKMGMNGRLYCESHFNRQALLGILEKWMGEMRQSGEVP